MNPFIRNSLAIIAGIIVGSIVNMGLIMLGSKIIAAPPGVDVTDMESLKSSMHLFEAKHFIFPFLAHALGTFVGAFTAVKVGTSHHMNLALGIAVFFLIGGVMNVFMLPSPVWFAVLDIIGAYLPMGWLAGKLYVLNRKD